MSLLKLLLDDFALDCFPLLLLAFLYSESMSLRTTLEVFLPGPGAIEDGALSLF